jgi:hypothetical protein
MRGGWIRAGENWFEGSRERISNERRGQMWRGWLRLGEEGLGETRVDYERKEKI